MSLVSECLLLQELEHFLVRADRSPKAPVDSMPGVVSRAESDDLFTLYDTDGSGTIDMGELLEMVACFKQTQSSNLNKAKVLTLTLTLTLTQLILAVGFS